MTNPIDTAALLHAWGETTQETWADAAGISAGMAVIAPDAPKVRRNVAACGGQNREANARFIALAHREWPALLDRIDALEGENFKLAAGCCINPGQHGLVGDQYGNSVCTAHEALLAEERSHTDALARVAELEAKVERLREAAGMAVAEMSRARGRLETVAMCNEDRRIAAALGGACDFVRSTALGDPS